MKYVSHPRQSSELLNQFLDKESSQLSKELTLWIKFHGNPGEEIEVQFFKSTQPNYAARLVSTEVTDFNKILHYNFASIAENRRFTRTVLLVRIE